MKLKFSLFLASSLTLAACSFDARIPHRPETPLSVLPKKEKVAEIRWDVNGVAHIRAANREKLLAAWGYVHGTERLWQMDYLHRLGLGMSAEIYGPGTLKTDFFLRLLGLDQKAKDLVESMAGTEELNLLTHYAAGVNRARMEQKDSLPHQFQHFKVQPLPWSPQASVLLALLQGVDMTSRTLVTDVQAEVARDRLGAERFEELFSIANEISRFETSIIHQADLGKPMPFKQRRGPDLEMGDGASTSGGSNVWALARGRSKSGNTIVANDTHLAIQNPSTWHELHLQLEDESLDVYGYGVPGMPVIAAGFSRNMAWGLTLGYTNAMDVVSYPLEQDGESFLNELGERIEIQDFAPDVRVRLGPIIGHIFWKGFKTSSEGLIYPIDVSTQENVVYVLKWSGHAVASTGIVGALEMMTANNVDSFDAALATLSMPNFNFIFGDRDGGIGFRQVGLTPRRTSGRQGVVQGTLPNEAWQGYLKASEMPALLRPERGFIVSSNNTPSPTPLWEGHYLGEGHRRGFRARRIEDLIEEKPTHSLSDVKKMQLDILVPDARILLPLMMEKLPNSLPLKMRPLRGLFANWDLQARVDSPAMTVFTLWVQTLTDHLFAEEMNELEDVPLRKAPFRPGIDALVRVLRGKISVSHDLSVALRESLIACFEKLHADLGEPGPNFEHWGWGNYHRLTLRSPSGVSAWDLGPFPLAGSERTVAKASEEGEGPYGVRSAASMRFVVELSNPPRAFGSYPGDNLDQEFRHPPAAVLDWLKGELRPMYFEESAISTHLKSQMDLIW